MKYQIWNDEFCMECCGRLSRRIGFVFGLEGFGFKSGASWIPAWNKSTQLLYLFFFIQYTSWFVRMLLLSCCSHFELNSSYDINPLGLCFKHNTLRMASWKITCLLLSYCQLISFLPRALQRPLSRDVFWTSIFVSTSFFFSWRLYLPSLCLRFLTLTSLLHPQNKWC